MRPRVALALTALVASALLLEGFTRAHPRVRQLEASAPTSSASIDARADRLHAVLAHDGVVYAIEDHFVYASVDTGLSYRRLGVLPKSGPQSLMARVRELVARSGVVRRVRRYAGPKGMLVLGSGTMVVFYDRIYRSEDGGRTFEAVPETAFPDLPAPFPSSLGFTVGPGDTVYYGEYTIADRPNSLRIVRGTDDGRRWEVAHTFAPGDVFHVHSVTYDPFREGYWVATGDDETEPKLLFTSDHFRTLHTVGCCSQDWRMVDLVVTEDALYWGSDDNRFRPGIFRYDVIADILERVADLDNPSYHAARLADGTLAISSTYEPRSPFTRNTRPPAATSLWLSSDGRSWSRAFSLAADSTEAANGSRAQLQLPHGDPLPALFATPWHTAEDAFTTLRFEIRR